MDGNSVPEENISSHKKLLDDSAITLQLKEEQLDIAKKWIETDKVNVYKETFLEEKSFTIPISREELVIERRPADSQTPEHKDISQEVIRIPVSEERVEFTKHKITLEDVSIYKQQLEDIKHIEAIIKKEKEKITTFGSPKVIDNETSSDIHM